MTTPSRYDIEKIRKQMSEKFSSRQDPDEFRPEDAKDGKVLKYRFFILPPLEEGDACKGGTASRDQGLWVLRHGLHWINKRPEPCPRILNDEDCELCSTGFSLMNELEKSEKDARRAISKKWLSTTKNMVNIYFIHDEVNPEAMRGTVKYFNADKGVFDIWDAAINRKDAGDNHDPQAHGVFFDEENAFLFQLEVKEKGGYNNYEASKFLAKSGPIPIAADKSGNPDRKAIDRILAQRVDLWTKVKEPSQEKIHKVYLKMVGGGDDDDDDATHAAGIETHGPAVSESAAPAAPVTAPPPPVQQPAATKPAATKPAKPVATKPAAVKPAKAAVAADDDDDDEDVNAILKKIQGGAADDIADAS